MTGFLLSYAFIDYPLSLARALMWAMLVAALVSVWRRHVGWRGIGFFRPRSWTAVLLIGVSGGISLQLLSIYALEPLLFQLTGAAPDYSDLVNMGELAGNWQLLGLSIVMMWIMGALLEEFFFRGYLLNRIADLFSERRRGLAAGLVLSSALFGANHVNYGVPVVIESGLFGIVFAALYLGTRCNLWTPLILHGVVNTTFLVLAYLGPAAGP